MFNVVLVEPEIPPNTGNIIRLCANTGAQLHLVKPLGFPLDDKRMIRAGLDYHEFANIRVHESWQALLEKEKPDFSRMFACTTHGSNIIQHLALQPKDWFVFGAETRGLNQSLRESFPTSQRIRLPMVAGQRSLNLSNAVAITIYEAWRQCDFMGGN